eukprot:scaffold22575_cov141-Cylindrotheca_fusiformis.AAC.4
MHCRRWSNMSVCHFVWLVNVCLTVVLFRGSSYPCMSFVEPKLAINTLQIASPLSFYIERTTNDMKHDSLRPIGFFIMLLGFVSPFQSFPWSRNKLRFSQHCKSRLLSFSNGGGADYSTEETLMKIHVAVADAQDENTKTRISKYTQSFPFAVILPVQPLQYLPMADGGVEVTFLRKKTREKGSFDGGLRFFIQEDRNGYDIVCKRNSNGQTVSKMFSEKQIVLAFLKGISGEDTEKTGAPPEGVNVESVFHKWL